ncbi:MAG: hypothetical protein U1A78_25055 [Polyangia bacterium]
MSSHSVRSLSVLTLGIWLFGCDGHALEADSASHAVPFQTQVAQTQSPLSADESKIAEAHDPTWRRIASGVFERREGTAVRRVHVGRAGLQADLDEAEAELLRLADGATGPASVDALRRRVSVLRKVLAGGAIPEDLLAGCKSPTWYPDVYLWRDQTSCGALSMIRDIFGPPSAPDQCSSSAMVSAGGALRTATSSSPRHLCTSDAALPHGGAACCMSGFAWLGCMDSTTGTWRTQSLSRDECK